MPTPRGSTPRDRSAHIQHDTDPLPERAIPHTTCPTDTDRPGLWSRLTSSMSDDAITGLLARRQDDSIVERGSSSSDRLTAPDTIHSNSPQAIPAIPATQDQETSTSEGSSPMSVTSDSKEAEPQLLSPSTLISSALGGSSPLNCGMPNIRMIPNHTSSYLRAGSKFKGTQQSDRQNYNVEVEIKNVDMAESELCGYLRIEGLTPDHPTLTTYFEGEIIGPKYTFQTRHTTWGATDKTDMAHWGRFPAWRPLSKQAKKPDFHYKNSAQRENIFMRWKESFLVPDHRVREILGASFEGFYYICFNQVTGNVSGIYFHSKSEKYQQLELRHVEDKGCYGAIEFR